MGQLPQPRLPLKEAPSPDIRSREGHTAVRDTAAYHPIPRSHTGRSRQEPWVRMCALGAHNGGSGPWGDAAVVTQGPGLLRVSGSQLWGEASLEPRACGLVLGPP
ncbi:unnamed protein product [Rangifer tarandus platyrhynchus]|uniref:Uncharacterized protein n=1 Tax=Rangifer tarandus platyrhynchus TaxID=3082113 RepID=A0AC59YAX9_RANTA